MKYLCKQFTLDFYERLNRQIELEVNKNLTDRGVHPERAFLSKSFERYKVKDFFNSLYNKPILFGEYPELISYYESLNLYPAEYTEITLDSKERGLQSWARVEWNGEIKKIDEIDEIFSYKSI